MALEAESKLMPVLQLGPRTQEVAHGVVHSLAVMLAPGCVPAFTSDGLNHYFYSLTAHFGEWRYWPSPWLGIPMKQAFRALKMERTREATTTDAKLRSPV